MPVVIDVQLSRIAADPSTRKEFEQLANEIEKQLYLYGNAIPVSVLNRWSKESQITWMADYPVPEMVDVIARLRALAA